MSSTVTETLIDLISRVQHIDADLVVPEASFADLGRTSLDDVELLVAIENRYGITLDYEAYAALETVQALSDAIADATDGAVQVSPAASR